MGSKVTIATWPDLPAPLIVPEKLRQNQRLGATFLIGVNSVICEQVVSVVDRLVDDQEGTAYDRISFAIANGKHSDLMLVGTKRGSVVGSLVKRRKAWLKTSHKIRSVIAHPASRRPRQVSAMFFARLTASIWFHVRFEKGEPCNFLEQDRIEFDAGVPRLDLGALRRAIVLPCGFRDGMPYRLVNVLRGGFAFRRDSARREKGKSYGRKSALDLHDEWRLQ